MNKGQKAQLDRIKAYSAEQYIKVSAMISEYNSIQDRAMRKFFSEGYFEKWDAERIEQFKRSLAVSNVEQLWNDYKIAGDPKDLVEENLYYRNMRGLGISEATEQQALFEVKPKLLQSDYFEKNNIRKLSYNRISKAIEKYKDNKVYNAEDISLNNYATGIGERTANQNSQSTETTISRDIEEDDLWVYEGGIPIETTRDFCRQRYGRKFTTKEVESWNKLFWDGKSGDVWIYTGGLNCRHVIFAV